MKLLHISDLHLGKRVNEFSMLEDQRHILKQLLSICDQCAPDALLIAGDVYDRAVPPAEAVELFDNFLTEVEARSLPLVMISGNHDSAERLGYGGRIFLKNKLHIFSQVHGSLPAITLTDSYGSVNIYPMPFLRPIEMRSIFPDRKLDTYEDAVQAVLEATPLNPSNRNVLLAHQFFIASGNEPLRSDSEAASVGGLDSINATLLDAFDYVALGHLHGFQRVGREMVRYSGSPLKYSFSEIHQQKGAVWVELQEKGNLHMELIPLTPLRDMREIRGPLKVLISPSTFTGTSTDDYIRAILTDEEEEGDAISQLRAVYPNLMRLDYDNTRTKLVGQGVLDAAEKKSALEMFHEFYLQQNGAPLSEEKARIITAILAEAGEGAFA